MSIAYIDPGNIESDLQAGVQTGYKLLWVLFWSTVMGLLLQLLGARLGIATGKNLAELCRMCYPRWGSILLWLMTEIAIIGSDIQEVVGSAIAMNLLSNGHIPLWAGVLITVADTLTFLLLEKRGIRKLEFFFGSLICVMSITFGIEYILSRPDQLEIVKGVAIPSIPTDGWLQAVGIIGAVIMPHNIYLHSALVQVSVIYSVIESTVALLISFTINLFVVAIFAQTFFGSAHESLGLSTAGLLLREHYGKIGYYVWALGLLASGQSSTMTGTYAGQFVMQGFLGLNLLSWKRVLLTRCIAVLPAITECVAEHSTPFCCDTRDCSDIQQKDHGKLRLCLSSSWKNLLMM
eukprot:TRINITY_DN4363_c0_g1_i1.p1 TRINITY_DN4363_c0_g1~~TRINITY_DN4363_c0_g1_i1.p1  ORF type:complete len:349 (-),score=45.22 TRINITY_DN4363_c0_g1_i1:247-1293(-)